MRLIDAEEFKHKLNNSKYYGGKVWKDILNMLDDCKTISVSDVIEKTVPQPTRLPERRYYVTFDREVVYEERTGIVYDDRTDYFPKKPEVSE